MPPMAMKTKTAAARCEPNPPTDVAIVSQIDALFAAPAQYIGVGVYQLHLNPLSGLNGVAQIIPVGNAFSPGNTVTFQVGFIGSGGGGGGGGTTGHGTIGVRITDPAGLPVEDQFFIQAELIGL